MEFRRGFENRDEAEGCIIYVALCLLLLGFMFMFMYGCGSNKIVYRQKETRLLKKVDSLNFKVELVIVTGKP